MFAPPSESIKRLKERAFTLVELIIVIAIVAVLGAITVPAYQGYVAKVREKTVILDMQSIAQEVFMFNVDNRRYPDKLVEIGYAGLKDPWGNPYQYFNITTAKGVGKLRKDHNNVPINTDFDLYSMGPDGKSVSPLTAKSSRDDIIRANDGDFFGKASDY